jgi:DNA polymerase
VSLAQLQDSWGDCQRCGLAETRTRLVFGEGNPNADIMIVGEGPGEHEDRSGRPFFGRAGEVLDQFLESVDLDRQEDLYITNVVCCRPTVEVEDDRSGGVRIDNRPPSKVEREACKERLLEQIYLVDPLLIIAVGKVPLQILTGKAPKMEAVRGRMRTFTMQGRHVPIRYALMPVYHTAFLARSHNRTKSGPWYKTTEDFVRAAQVIDHLRETYYGIEPPESRREVTRARKRT